MERDSSRKYPAETRFFRLTLLTLALIWLSITGPGIRAFASEPVAAPQEQKTVKGIWKKKKNYFYYYINGKAQKGLREISGKKYFFDKSGKQMTGWRKIGKNYRYFVIENGAKGCMVSGKKVNGISIKKDGTAVVNKTVKLKLSLLTRYQKLADRLVKPGMKKKDKLVRVFKAARDRPYSLLAWPSASGRWDERLAALYLELSRIDCTAQAAGFAYLANAVGYKKVAIRLYGHAHVEIDHKVYDPGFAKTVSDSNYTRFFNKTHKELGRMGRERTAPLRYI